ncbi:MAG: hypothetical protein HC921_16985 [Synechococcaceae cyanobacterium SM2_3_1]|nr:hypothetical protein [Synechococcaceae cyanobacterium SM2_3_1]
METSIREIVARVLHTRILTRTDEQSIDALLQTCQVEEPDLSAVETLIQALSARTIDCY